MHFNSAYHQQLIDHYPDEIVRQITDVEYQALLPDGESVPYIVTHPDEPIYERPVFYVPGFGEGIINKASFAAELAVRGVSFVLPGQNRHKIVEDAVYGRNATVAQARNYLAVLDRAVANDQPVDIAAHSYGSLIFQQMVELNPERFKDSSVALLAPAGSIHDESLHDLGRRWVGMIRSEMDKKRPAAFPDEKGVTGRASAKNLAANLPRMKQEIGELAHARVDYATLVNKVGSLTVISYAEDKMFPEDRMSKTLGTAVETGVRWMTPVSPDKVLDGTMRYGGHGAVHDDEQFNPARVAASLLQAFER